MHRAAPLGQGKHRCEVPSSTLNDFPGIEMSSSCKLGLAHQCVISTSLGEELAITYFVGTVGMDGIMKFKQPDYIRDRYVTQ